MLRGDKRWRKGKDRKMGTGKKGIL